MRVLAAAAVASIALVGARFARIAAVDVANTNDAALTAPFAPSPSTAPFIAVGYREMFADLLYVRLIGYFNGDDSTGDGVADLAEAVVALDPQFERVYEHGANAMTLARHGVSQSVYLRAVALLEHGAKVFPHNWRLPYLAGQMYSQDLKTEDKAQRRTWDEHAILLIESAIRKPGAPAKAATWAAMMRTRLGQHARAIASLKEMALISNDADTRARLMGTLAQLEEKDAAAIAGEIDEQRMRFLRQWRQERPSVNASMYLLIGPPLRPGFDMTDLATGGRDLYVSTEEPLEPLE